MITRDRKLIGGTGFIRGGYHCVCFTEAPITEAASLFNLSSLASREQRPRYEPYGVAVAKEWLFERGGRPVIYQPDDEFDFLSTSQRWRHARYEPSTGVDFTWEREWRIQTTALELDPAKTLIVVPEVREAFDLMYDHSELVAVGHDDEGFVERTAHEPSWLAVSLDFFGVDAPS